MGPIYQNKTMKYTKNSNDNGNHDIIDPVATVYIMNGAGGQNFYTPKPCKDIFLYKVKCI